MTRRIRIRCRNSWSERFSRIPFRAAFQFSKHHERQHHHQRDSQVGFYRIFPYFYDDNTRYPAHSDYPCCTQRPNPTKTPDLHFLSILNMASVDISILLMLHLPPDGRRSHGNHDRANDSHIAICLQYPIMMQPRPSRRKLPSRSIPTRKRHIRHR